MRERRVNKALQPTPDGPDVRVLGAKNRLDVVLRRNGVGSIGIEIKCLGKTGHTGKLTQALGRRFSVWATGIGRCR